MRLQWILDYERNRDERGVNLKVSFTWSRKSDTAGSSPLNGSPLIFDTVSYADNTGIQLEMGYEIEILDGSALITPYSAFDQTDNHGSELQVGSRIKTDSGIELGLEAFRNVPESGSVGHEYNLT